MKPPATHQKLILNKGLIAPVIVMVTAQINYEVELPLATLSASFLFEPARTKALFDHPITQIGL